MSQSVEFDALVAVLREHQAVATGLGEWACKCSPSEWRPTIYRSRHVAEAVFAAGFTTRDTPPGVSDT